MKNIQDKKRLKQFLVKFSSTGFKNGDLVITAEIHRVVDSKWGHKNGSRRMEVVTVWPECETCKTAKQECRHSRIMSSGKAGQQSIMRLLSK